MFFLSLSLLGTSILYCRLPIFFLCMVSSENKYERRGVSASKEEVHDAVVQLDKGLYPRAFCKVFPDIGGQDPSYATVLHADGAGTKASLAYVYWRETGDCSVWAGIAQDAIVMNLDDLLCVGVAHQPILFSSLINRNKRHIPAAVLAALIEGHEAFLEQLRSWGIEAYLAGGETADVGDLVRSVSVDGTAVVRMLRKDVIANRIQPGDLIVGLSSSGQAAYETTYNSGVGSNGLTLLRHELFCKKYAARYPESFDPALGDLGYAGPYAIEDPLEGPQEGALDEAHNSPIGRLVLSPTRTYMPIFKEIFPQYAPRIHGMVHCTGGGQTKVLHFLQKGHVVKDDLFTPPPLFGRAKEAGGLTWREMYAVFNMGHLLEVYTDRHTAEALMQAATRHQVSAKVIGRVEEAAVPKLSLRHPLFGTLVYEKK